MAKKYTNFDAANTAVRAYLYTVSERILTLQYVNEAEWQKIRDIFHLKCAYCGKPASKKQPLTREHLDECNQLHCGLHICSNVVPAHTKCNQSRNKMGRDEKIRQIKLKKEFRLHQKKYKKNNLTEKNQEMLNKKTEDLYKKVALLVKNAIESTKIK
ncbi:MAG: hypothetical protein IPO49_13500 [Bacteroidetes bacterium]|nr:hypothetical protein [Bacteroidota bacterium]MBK9543299.1 hypothetical protein [Bacteroidota bacterium]MBP6402908.1 hypothetical protein [Bacteroidia bacterium]